MDTEGARRESQVTRPTRAYGLRLETCDSAGRYFSVEGIQTGKGWVVEHDGVCNPARSLGLSGQRRRPRSHVPHPEVGLVGVGPNAVGTGQIWLGFP